MLAEMGVRVWWPAPAADSAVAEASPPPAPPAPPARGAAVPPARLAPEGAAPRPAVPSVPSAAIAPVAAAQIARLDWPGLQQAVAACQACGLCKTRTQTVFGVGPDAGPLPPQVDWLVVGEAPGENEDLQGEPFVGQAGKLLDNMLKAIGLSRRGADGLQGAFIANVLKCRPPGNRNPQPDEVAQCLPYLERQVALLQPKIILAAGRFAVQALLQDTVPDVATVPLGKLRGRVHQYRGVPVVVTYHPAYLLRTLPEKAKAWADLCLALDTLAGR
ncbi:MAG TPA: uracil-DNA glycosylase [Burkholderiaceae bacterium]